MAEVLTRGEMEARYRGEWILVGDPEWDERSGLRRGTVLVHNQDHDEFSRQTLALRPRPTRSAFLYLGELPEHILLPIA